MLITIIFFITYATLFGATALAQSVELLDALKVAEEHQQQGEYAKAFGTLKAIQSNVSADEFHHTDVAFGNLVRTLLENRESDKAALVAAHIANQPLRNETLLYVLRQQCYAASQTPDKFNQMLGKAQRTATLLTDSHRDLGYLEMTRQYVHTGKFDLAQKALNKINDVQHRDSVYLWMTAKYVSLREFDLALESLKKIKDIKQCGQYEQYVWHQHDNILLDTAKLGIDKDRSERTKKNETTIRSLIDRIQSPTMKAQGLLALAEYLHRTSGDEQRLALLRETKTRRLAVLREAEELSNTHQLLQIHGIHLAEGRETEALEILRKATELILSSPDSEGKLQQLRQLEKIHRDADREGDAEEMRGVVLATIENIHRVNAERIRQSPQLYTPFDDTDRMRFDQYVALLRQKPSDGEIVERIQGIAENTADPFTRAYRWATLLEFERHLRSPSEARQKELFDNARQAALQIDDPNRRIDWLGSYHGRYTSEESDILRNDIVETVLSSGDAVHNGRYQIETVFLQLANQQGNIDWMLELLFSERIPDDWKASLYGNACYALLGIADDAEFKTREDDLRKLIDLIEKPQERFRILESANMGERLQTPEDWIKRAETALAIEAPGGRFSACNTMFRWAFGSYRTATWMNSAGESGYLPLLLDAMEEIAKATTDIGTKEAYYRETLYRAQHHVRIQEHTGPLWDEKKLADWREEHEAIFAQIPNGSDRWNRLYQMVESSRLAPIATAKNDRIDTLLAEARNIPLGDCKSRLNALLITAERALNYELLDKSQAIIDETFAYIKTIPILAQDHRSSDVVDMIERVHSFNDRRLGYVYKQIAENDAMVEKYLAIARETPAEDYDGRIKAYYSAAQYASGKGQERYQAIVDEVREYIKTIPEKNRRSSPVSGLFQWFDPDSR